MTPTPARPEPTTPDPQHIFDDCEIEWFCEGNWPTSDLLPRLWQCALNTMKAHIDEKNQRLTSEPAASVSVTLEQIWAVVNRWDAEHAADIAIGTNVGALVDAILALLAASTGARGAVVEEIAKRHKAIIGKQLDIGARDKATAEAVRDAFADRAKLLALIGAKQP